MAGENSELTFVRCPSCRSLVPAISTKCRMCGATFESAKADEDKAKNQAGRARQHTGSISGASEELELPTAKPTPPPPPSATFKSSKPEPMSNGHDIDDPLRNFLEEVEVEEEQHEQEAPLSAPASFEVAPKAPPAPQREARPTPPPPPAQPKPAAPPSQVVVESGRGRPGGLSFGKSDNRGDNRESRKPEPQQQASQPQQEQRREQQPKPNQAPQKQNFQPKVDAPQRQAPPPQPERRQEAPRAAAPAPAPTNKVVIHEGDLVGWLVDYRDPRGLGVEIRESQFFVSRERLKPSDMILDDESISTPHAMVRITRQNGVEIQDLMSESGIRVRRRDSTSWQTVEERVKLQHGDRVQFGNIEYLIVLVPVD